MALVLMVILALLLSRDLLHFISSFARGGGSNRGAPELQEVVVEDKGAGDKIALVEVQGMISGEFLHGLRQNMVGMIKEQLKMAAADTAVKAVLLKVDSPGGEVMASDEIYRALERFQTESRKPVVVSMGSLAASGGYYVSAPCRWIVANELTITGSIGVIMHGYNYRALMDKVGVRPDIYKSGKFKDMLSGDKRQEDILPEERQMAQALIDQTYNRFTNIVATGRQNAEKKNQGKGRALHADWQEYVDGRILSGTDAYKHGFVDELGNFDTALERTKKLAGLNQASLVRYVQSVNLLDMLSWFVKTETPALKVDLGLDLPKLSAGRMYFLAPSLWH